MRLIAHISDLHFGREDPAVTEGLLADLLDLSPSLVAVSGDLTQRARRREFAAARAFLDRIPYPTLVVPGNHDIPLYNVVRRMGRPLDRYREFITADMAPVHLDDEIAVLGVNTARSLVFKGGRVSREQIAEIRKRLCPVAPSIFKVVVTHHQFVAPPGTADQALVGRASDALAQLAACGVDLLLAGHLHVGYSGDVRDHHPTVLRSILVAQAGTAISTRGRGEPNAYNAISIDGERVSIGVRAWEGTRFAEASMSRFDRVDDGWRRAR